MRPQGGILLLADYGLVPLSQCSAHYFKVAMAQVALRDKVAAMKANADPEQHSPSTSSTVESQDFENYSISISSDHSCPDYRSPYLQCHDLDPEAAFDSRYTVGKLPGKEVAIKLVRKHPHLKSMMIPGTTREALVEMMIMQTVSEPCCSNIVQLLEWFEMTDRFVMVLEKPSPCLDLSDFVTLQGGRLTEAQARDIMLQAIRAARHCSDHRVLHHNIKAENLIISTDTMQVKLTNFGCGALIKDVPYTEYTSNLEFSPPELEMDGVYTGIPCTVWGLGILLFSLVDGDLPFQSMTKIEKGDLKLCPGVSQDFFNLLMWCLDLEPDFRPSFEDIISHEWFTEAV